jgi:hypothetical protein
VFALNIIPNNTSVFDLPSAIAAYGKEKLPHLAAHIVGVSAPGSKSPGFLLKYLRLKFSL